MSCTHAFIFIDHFQAQVEEMINPKYKSVPLVVTSEDGNSVVDFNIHATSIFENQEHDFLLTNSLKENNPSLILLKATPLHYFATQTQILSLLRTLSPKTRVGPFPGSFLIDFSGQSVYHFSKAREYHSFLEAFSIDFSHAGTNTDEPGEYFSKYPTCNIFQTSPQENPPTTSNFPLILKLLLGIQLLIFRSFNLISRIGFSSSLIFAEFASRYLTKSLYQDTSIFDSETMENLPSNNLKDVFRFNDYDSFPFAPFVTYLPPNNNILSVQPTVSVLSLFFGSRIVERFIQKVTKSGTGVEAVLMASLPPPTKSVPYNVYWSKLIPTLNLLNVSSSSSSKLSNAISIFTTSFLLEEEQFLKTPAKFLLPTPSQIQNMLDRQVNLTLLKIPHRAWNDLLGEELGSWFTNALNGIDTIQISKQPPNKILSVELSNIGLFTFGEIYSEMQIISNRLAWKILSDLRFNKRKPGKLSLTIRKSGEKPTKHVISSFFLPTTVSSPSEIVEILKAFAIPEIISVLNLKISLKDDITIHFNKKLGFRLTRIGLSCSGFVTTKLKSVSLYFSSDSNSASDGNADISSSRLERGSVKRVKQKRKLKSAKAKQPKLSPSIIRIRERNEQHLLKSQIEIQNPKKRKKKKNKTLGTFFPLENNEIVDIE